MRPFLTILLFISFSYASGQQWKATGAYSLGLPKEGMGKNIQPAHSLQGGLLVQLPKNLKRLSVGAELGLGIYANKRIEQTFLFDNTATVLPVNYSSNVFDANLQVRFDLLSDKNLLIPYVNLKGGLYNFFSTIRIDDPDDPDGCHALERKNIINDKTLYWSGGGGIQINWNTLVKEENRGNAMLDLSVNLVRGGSINYINTKTKHLIDAQDINDPQGKPLQKKFINASTQSIHEHTVAQLYTTPLRFLEFRLGVVAILD